MAAALPGAARAGRASRAMALVRTSAAAAVLLLAAAAASLPRGAQALDFEMTTQTKCVYEEINAGALVVGDYAVVHRENPTQAVFADVRVTDPTGGLLHENRGQTKGQFAFTAKSAGEHAACFTVADPAIALHTKLSVDWRTGVAATDWDNIAKKEHLDALSVEMRKLEGSIREIYAEMLQLQQREQEMRDLNEITNARVAWFSIFSLAVTLGTGAFTVFHLRGFFKKRKLV